MIEGDLKQFYRDLSGLDKRVSKLEDKALKLRAITRALWRPSLLGCLQERDSQQVIKIVRDGRMSYTSQRSTNFASCHDTR